MELNCLLAAVLLLSGTVLGQQGQQNQQPAEFRQLQEPIFTPPLPLNNNNQGAQNFQQFAHRQQQFNQQPQPQALPQQQQQQPQFNQRQQPQPHPQPQQNFNNFNQPGGTGQETLPTLPPVFIPPNTPQGPPPQLQSPIRNLFRQPGGGGGGGGDGFSLSGIINRFFNLFNLNNN